MSHLVDRNYKDIVLPSKNCWKSLKHSLYYNSPETAFDYITSNATIANLCTYALFWPSPTYVHIVRQRVRILLLDPCYRPVRLFFITARQDDVISAFAKIPSSLEAKARASTCDDHHSSSHRYLCQKTANNVSIHVLREAHIQLFTTHGQRW